MFFFKCLQDRAQAQSCLLDVAKHKSAFLAQSFGLCLLYWWNAHEIHTCTFSLLTLGPMLVSCSVGRGAQPPCERSAGHECHQRTLHVLFHYTNVYHPMHPGPSPRCSLLHMSLKHWRWLFSHLLEGLILTTSLKFPTIIFILRRWLLLNVTHHDHPRDKHRFTPNKSMLSCRSLMINWHGTQTRTIEARNPADLLYTLPKLLMLKQELIQTKSNTLSPWK